MFPPRGLFLAPGRSFARILGIPHASYLPAALKACFVASQTHAANESQRPLVLEVLDDAQRLNLTVLRCWVGVAVCVYRGRAGGCGCESSCDDPDGAVLDCSQWYPSTLHAHTSRPSVTALMSGTHCSASQVRFNPRLQANMPIAGQPCAPQ